MQTQACSLPNGNVAVSMRDREKPVTRGTRVNSMPREKDRIITGFRHAVLEGVALIKEWAAIFLWWHFLFWDFNIKHTLFFIICVPYYVLGLDMKQFPSSGILQRVINNSSKERTTLQDHMISSDMWEIASLPGVNSCNGEHLPFITLITSPASFPLALSSLKTATSSCLHAKSQF